MERVFTANAILSKASKKRQVAVFYIATVSAVIAIFYIMDATRWMNSGITYLLPLLKNDRCSVKSLWPLCWSYSRAAHRSPSITGNAVESVQVENVVSPVSESGIWYTYI